MFVLTGFRVHSPKDVRLNNKVKLDYNPALYTSEVRGYSNIWIEAHHKSSPCVQIGCARMTEHKAIFFFSLFSAQDASHAALRAEHLTHCSGCSCVLKTGGYE